MNNIQILGTITKEIKLNYSASGTAIASFSIVYNEKRKDANGNYNDVVHFFDVTAFSKTAENIQKFFNIGSRILIDGSLDYQSWEKDGQKRSRVGIKLSKFDFIDRKSDSQQQNQAPQQNQQYQQQQRQAPQQQPYYPDDSEFR